MKKFIISLLVIMAIILLNQEKIVIPKESIRLRVIANSNSIDDQNTKLEVKREIEKELVKIMNNVSSIEEARTTISNNLGKIDNVVKNALNSNNYSINYGLNYFPLKKYHNLVYKEGMYESVVVTLGSGSGDNWWCVLFPPFCLIEAENSDNIEYTWKIKEIINKYF